MELFSAEQLQYLDNLYVKKNDCNDRHTEAAKEITELTVQQAKITTQLSLLIKINSATLGAVGAAIVAAVMKLILK